MINSAPVFIMSSERSGSNLLRVLLGNHSRIADPVAVQLLASFSVTSRLYFPVSTRDKAERLFNEITSIVNHEYHKWGFDRRFDEFYVEGKNYNFMDYFKFFYYSQVAKNGPRKTRPVIKENATFNYCFELLHHFPEAKFIYLYRDPRDYVASWMKVPLGIQSPDAAINQWVEEQSKCDVAINVFGLPSLAVKYEDLISDTPRAIDTILDYLGEDHESSCYTTDQDKNSQYNWNEYWKNLDKPVLTSNKGKFLQDLDDKVLFHIENTAHDLMFKLGYERITPLNYDVSSRKDNLILKFRRIDELKKQFGATDSEINLDKTVVPLKSRQDLTDQLVIKAKEHASKNE